jgi:HEAT repeat protein
VSPIGALTAALDAAPAGQVDRRADLALALGLQLAAARAGEDEARTLATARLIALAEEVAQPFPVRARCIEGLGRIAGATPSMAAEQPVVLQALVGLRQRSPDPVLRRLATRALASIRHPLVAPAMRAALADDDPAVRELAAAALARLGDRQATSLLIAGAKQEPWPSVRRAEVAALGALCGPGAADLLARAVERDADDVRRAALSGLVNCKDARAVDTLLTVLKRERESATLRSFAALQLARAGDTRAALPMAEALARIAVEAQADLALEGAAMATLRALGTLGGPAAVKAALTHAGDPRPSLRRTAIETLGRLCDASGNRALAAATRDQDPGVATAATAGLRRCGGRAEHTGKQTKATVAP